MAADIEGFVLGKIRNVGKDAGVIAQAMEAARKEFEDRKPALVAELQRLGQLRQNLESQQDALLDALGAGGERPKAVGRRVERLVQEIDGITVEQERIRADLAALKGQARVAHLLIEKVTCNATEGIVNLTFRPGGIKAFAEERNGDDYG